LTHKFFLFFAFTIFLNASVNAADFKVFNGMEGVDIVSLQGEIVEGDSDRFYALVKDRERVAVMLASPGGLVKEALRIGAKIRTDNFSTMVAPEGECFSACGLIWLSGARRYMSSNSLIGFHAAYREENGEYKESGVANAEIGSFLTHMGLRIEAIRFFTVAGPNEFLLLTPVRARALGIDIFEQHENTITTPFEVPTVDRHARRFVYYGILESRCMGFFKPDLDTIKQSQTKAFREGNLLVGSDKWIDIWLLILEEMKTEIAKTSPLMICLEIENELRSEGQQTGVDGPSFSCSKASTATEKAICENAILWTKDRAMNSLYFFIRSFGDTKLREKFLNDQREWIQVRDFCRNDKNCLNEIYDQRLNSFKEVDIPS